MRLSRLFLLLVVTLDGAEIVSMVSEDLTESLNNAYSTRQSVSGN